jgi:hypothetical protein
VPVRPYQSRESLDSFATRRCPPGGCAQLALRRAESGIRSIHGSSSRQRATADARPVGRPTAGTGRRTTLRVRQPEGTKGSLKWIQRAVASNPNLLAAAIRDVGALQLGEQINWSSPRPDDGWAEYRDGDFLDRVGHPELRPALTAFWPTRGPQWDALGRGSGGTVVLVEAKSHFGELTSSCQAAPESLAVIERSLAATKTAIGTGADADWLNGFYQYANRVAHLQFLRDHMVPAVLVFVYFTNDREMGGPRSREEWEAGLLAVHRHLGFNADSNSAGIVSIYIDTETLA